ncbi:MAG: metallophosphoesterase [Promethearchaeota archaeon]
MNLNNESIPNGKRNNLKHWILVILRNFFVIFLVLSPIVIYLGVCFLIEKSAPTDKMPYVHWNGLDPSKSVYISWETAEPTASYVIYGKNQSLSEGYMENSTLTTMHHIILKNLQPNTRYFFKAGSSISNLHDKIFTFSTAPLPSNDISFNFTIISDTQQFMGTGHYDRIATAIADPKHGDTSFVMFAGDMGQEPDDQYTWNFFMHQTEKYSDHLPIVPCMGNHDKDESSTNTLYHKYFNISLYNASSTIPAKNYYAFNWSKTLFIIMDISEPSDVNPSTPYAIEQDQWLNKTLSEGQSQDYRIIIFHRPIYTGTGNNPILINRLVPAFQKYNVSMVFYGHEHIYERLFIDNITYVNVAGGGGMQNPAYYPTEGLQKVAMGPFFTRIFIDSSKVVLKTYSPTFDLIDQAEMIKIGTRLILKEVPN